MTLAGAACTRAENRTELQQALFQSWDLIIADLHLPDIEEDELVNAIATAQAKTPYIVLSGSVDHLKNIAMPGNVFDRIEKGDHSALHAALTGSWQ